MTREEILAMEPGRELDAFVAEKVMGWKECGLDGWRNKIAYGKPADFDEKDPRVRIDDYSTDISAAWEVVEKVPIDIIHPYAGFRLLTDGKSVTVSFDGVEISAKTAPEAICKAALLAVMEDES